MLFLGCLDDAVCFFLAVWTTRRALSWLFGRRGVHFSTVAAAEARTSYSSFGGEHGGRGADGNFFFLMGSRRRRRDDMHFSFDGDHGGVGRDDIFFFWRGARRRRWGRQVLFFGSGTAEVIRHRRRDLRAGRLPLRLFDSDRNDDSHFSSRLALRR